MPRSLTRALALLVPPLLVLASAHELYLRNQRELERTLSVLYPFWAAGLLAALVAGTAALAADRLAARLVLAAYYGAGLGFMVWSFLRALPPGAHLLRWILDTQAGAAAFLALVLVGTLLLASRVDPRDLEPFFAVLAAVLLAHEAIAFGARLDRGPAPPPRDVVAELADRGDPRLPNVYHLILDSFQDELFETHLPPGGEESLAGFVRFRTTSRSYATSLALPATFTGRWQGLPTEDRVKRALVGEESIIPDLRAAGFATIAFVPRYIYSSQPAAFDVVVFHDQNVPEPDARALNAAVFTRLWLFRTLPLAVSERLARGELLGFGADFFEMKGVERVATLTKPLLSLLSTKGWLQIEPRLPARGRYTLVHLALPHAPFRLRADCSDPARTTDLGEQTGCSLRLLVRFLDLLRDLDRLDDAIVLVHGDHGSGLQERDGRLVEDESAWGRTLLLTKSAGARGPLRLAEEEARIEDIAPTLLALLGISKSAAFEGQPLAEALPAERAGWSPVDGGNPRSAALSDEVPRQGSDASRGGGAGRGLTAPGPLATMPGTRRP